MSRVFVAFRCDRCGWCFNSYTGARKGVAERTAIAMGWDVSRWGIRCPHHARPRIPDNIELGEN